VIVHVHIDEALFKIVCVFVLFYACKFYIHGERKIWEPCLEDELTSCVVLVFVLDDVLWDQLLVGGLDYIRMINYCFLKDGGFTKQVWTKKELNILWLNCMFGS
jgi:hypothetical protein